MPPGDPPQFPTPQSLQRPVICDCHEDHLSHCWEPERGDRGTDGHTQLSWVYGSHRIKW